MLESTRTQPHPFSWLARLLGRSVARPTEAQVSAVATARPSWQVIQDCLDRLGTVPSSRAILPLSGLAPGESESMSGLLDPFRQVLEPIASEPSRTGSPAKEDSAA